MRPFVDVNDRYSYEDWMNRVAADVDESPRRVVKRWRGRTFVYFCTNNQEIARG